MFDELPAWAGYAYFFVAGLVVGSFLNVLILRLPREQSLIKPPSRCRRCEAPIRWYDNIPVISWLMLRGRCRACSESIGARYPLIELATGLLFLAASVAFGTGAGAWVASLFLALMLALAVIDLEHMILPDVITLPGIALGLVLQPWIPGGSFVHSLIGALAGAGALILLINTWYWLREEESMGLGDVNMMAMLGAFLGWRNGIVALAVATAAGALIGIAMMLFGRAGWKSKIPFGVFLAIGGAVALFWGGQIAGWYVGWYR